MKLLKYHYFLLEKNLIKKLFINKGKFGIFF
jgi:hypothetical protein